MCHIVVHKLCMSTVYVTRLKFEKYSKGFENFLRRTATRFSASLQDVRRFVFQHENSCKVKTHWNINVRGLLRATGPVTLRYKLSQSQPSSRPIRVQNNRGDFNSQGFLRAEPRSTDLRSMWTRPTSTQGSRPIPARLAIKIHSRDFDTKVYTTSEPNPLYYEHSIKYSSRS